MDWAILNEKKISRGDVWLVDLEPTVGHEQAKCRPCVVISAETFNQGPTELIVILPLTSRYRPLSWLVPVDPPEGGLSKRSYIVCNQPRTVSFQRFFGTRLGNIQPEKFEEIDQRLRFLLCL